MLNIKPLNQRDPLWAKVILGDNTDPQFTIGGYGCLITCLAMVSCYYGHPETPNSLNEKLKKAKKFTNGGFYVWGGLTAIDSDIQEKATLTPAKLTDAQIKEVKKSIDAGYPVMCQIDFQPLTATPDMHYILLIGYSDEDFTMADPWTGTIAPLAVYLKATKPTVRDTIEQYYIYTGKVPVQAPSELETVKKALTDMTTDRDYQKGEKEKYKDERNQLRDVDVPTLKSQITGINALLDKQKGDIATLQSTNNKQTDDIISLTTERNQSLQAKTDAEQKLVEFANKHANCVPQDTYTAEQDRAYGFQQALMILSTHVDEEADKGAQALLVAMDYKHLFSLAFKAMFAKKKAVKNNA